jgi:hypothetical protein
VIADAGPLATSICSTLNRSRLTTPGSRTPSMEMSLRAVKPRT